MKRIIGVILVLTLLLGFCGCSIDLENKNQDEYISAPKAGYSSKEALLDAIVSMYFGAEDVTETEYRRLTADGWWERLAIEGVNVDFAQWSASKKEFVELTKQQFGENYKVVYTVTSEETFSADQIPWNKNRAEIFGTENPSICNVELCISIKGYEDQTQELLHIAILEANGRWYLYNW